jgi:CubicO group peptidase (beta-lactamase class C family)
MPAFRARVAVAALAALASGLTAPSWPQSATPDASSATAKSPTAESPTAEGPTAEGPTAKGPTAKGPTAKGEEQLIGFWSTQLDFAPALKGPLTITRTGEQWTASIAGAQAIAGTRDDTLRFVFSAKDGKTLGEFRGVLKPRTGIEGWWLRPSGETRDRRDPGGSGQPFATRVDLKQAGPDRWSGTVRPLDDRFTLYLKVFRNAEGALTGAFRNHEIGSNGGATNFEVRRTGDAVQFRVRYDDTSPEFGPDATFVRAPDRLRLLWPDVGQVLELQRRTAAEVPHFFPRPPGEPKYRYQQPAALADGWTTATAREAGMDEAKLEKFVQRLIDYDPAQRRAALIHSVLVAYRGKLVLEEYFYGYGRDTPHDLRSAGKTWSAVMLGAAKMQGAPLSPETRVYELLAPLGPFANPDPRKQRITLAHLMTHTSGLDCNDNDEKSLGNENTLQSQDAQPDWWKYTLDLPMVHEPGTRYAYCSANTNLVGAALTIGTRTWLPELFDRTVARPLEFDEYHWNLTPTGEGYQGGGSFLRPRDFLKVGQAYLNGGTWNGRRIVETSWVAESTAPRVDVNPATTGLSEEEFANNYGLGRDAYTWHPGELRLGDRVYKEYGASGNGGQLLVVVPELQLAVVFTAANYRQGGIWGRFRDQIVPQEIIASIK